jgi:hypothetical protein
MDDLRVMEKSNNRVMEFRSRGFPILLLAEWDNVGTFLIQLTSQNS